MYFGDRLRTGSTLYSTKNNAADVTVGKNSRKDLFGALCKQSEQFHFFSSYRFKSIHEIMDCASFRKNLEFEKIFDQRA
jgi:hypothetical protein